MNFIERKIVEGKVNAWLKAHWPAVMAVGGGAVTFLMPSVQAYQHDHATTFIGTLFGCVIAAYYAQSPLKKKPQ